MTQPDDNSDEAAARWLDALRTPDAHVQEAFGDWLTTSPNNVRAFLLMTATERDIERVRAAGLIDARAMLEQELREDSGVAAMLAVVRSQSAG